MRNGPSRAGTERRRPPTSLMRSSWSDPSFGAGLAHHVIAQLAWIGEIRHAPAVEVVLGHALLGESLEPVGVAGRHGAEERIPADFFGRTAVVDLVELVPCAELRSD